MMSSNFFLHCEPLSQDCRSGGTDSRISIYGRYEHTASNFLVGILKTENPRILRHLLYEL